MSKTCQGNCAAHVCGQAQAADVRAATDLVQTHAAEMVDLLTSNEALQLRIQHMESENAGLHMKLRMAEDAMMNMRSQFRCAHARARGMRTCMRACMCARSQVLACLFNCFGFACTCYPHAGLETSIHAYHLSDSAHRVSIFCPQSQALGRGGPPAECQHLPANSKRSRVAQAMVAWQHDC